MINFPVLKRVKVTEYAIYAGTADKPGLDHVFVPGVNVIVGINGLGKTTLLNVLLRGLTGPADVPGDDELGDKRRRIVASDRSWFRKRAPDAAVNARATIWFSLGEREFEVTRALANLDVVELSVDQQPLPMTRSVEMEATYREHVVVASGLASFDDFVFLLRYIVFYLEDRRSLVWDTAAQGDILGILVDEQGQRRGQYVELFNDLLSKDSEYRNMRAVLYRRKKDAEKQAATIEGGEIQRHIQALEERRGELKALVARKNELSNERDLLREQIENRRQEIHDGRAAMAAKLNGFYESFFPQLAAPARYLLAHFEAGAGCLVCGTNTAEAKEKIEGTRANVASMPPRMREVLYYLCLGLTNKAIAARMGISEGTVRKDYVSELLRTFGVARRTELMLEVFQRGLRIPPPEHAKVVDGP